MQSLPEYLLPPASTVRKLRPSDRRRRFVFVASANPDPMELIAPMNLLRIANFVLEISGKTDHGYDFEVVTTQPGDIYAAHGLKISVDRTYNDLEGVIDTLLITPMDFEDLLRGDQELFFEWLRQNFDNVRRIGSLCSATYVLAEAGLLDGRRVTTHWDLEEDFRRRYPDVNLDIDPIYIKDGHLYSSAGMTAGIDLMLALVEEDFGAEVALRVAQGLVLFLRRPGGQSQFSTQLSHQFSEKAEISEIQAYIYQHIAEDLSVESLASQVSMSPRNFSRVFMREIGEGPGRYVELCRLEMARQHLQETREPMSNVADQCGYRSADTMRQAFERQLGVSPREYRERFSSAIRPRLIREVAPG